jgi:hypothetical protein
LEVEKDCAMPEGDSLMLEKEVRSTRSVVGLFAIFVALLVKLMLLLDDDVW